MSGVGQRFAAIAEAIERGGDLTAVPQRIEQARAACAQAAAASAEARQQLEQVQQALQAWKDVWPRMSGQREFCMAVAREARLWAKRFEAA